jgi:uncharacterized protein YcbX
MARIARINVTAVKSLALDHPVAVELTTAGAVDDRRFFLVDDGGRLYNAKRDTLLVRSRATWHRTTGALTVLLPDGVSVAAEVAYDRDMVTEIYGRSVSGRRVVGPWAEALSDVAGRAVTLVERVEGAWATDSRPATLMGQSSLAVFGDDGRRFRMLFELDGMSAYEEDTWRSRRLRIGEIVLLAGEPTPRCVVPSANPDTGAKDMDMLRELLAVRGPIDGDPCLGVYAEVLEPGVVRVGDEVEVI